MYPVECVVRGYLTGSGWKEYQVSQTVCGVPLPAGLHERRPPARAHLHARLEGADGRARREHLVRAHRRTGRGGCRGRAACALARDLRRASAIAEEAGLILADTKFEFGADRESGQTPARRRGAHERLQPLLGCRRLASGRTPDERMASFDKQIVRDWLAANWDQVGQPPALPGRDRRADRRPLPGAAPAVDRGVGYPGSAGHRPPAARWAAARGRTGSAAVHLFTLVGSAGSPFAVLLLAFAGSPFAGSPFAVRRRRPFECAGRSPGRRPVRLFAGAGRG